MRPAALLPHLADLIVDRILTLADMLVVEAALPGRSARCPTCGRRSRHIHSHSVRTLADTPVGGRCVAIRLRVRRFACRHEACPRRTFTEQASTLASRHARRTVACRRFLERVGLALGGRPGARFAGLGDVATSRSTLLRLVRALPEPPTAAPRILGVDDFALRRGDTYATLLVDLETRRPVDILPDATGATFAAWLRDHGQPVVICRDRGGAYADGARQAAPDAVQVADRWHLAKNLAEAVEQVVLRQHTNSAEEEPLTPEPDGALPLSEPTSTPVVTSLADAAAAVPMLGEANQQARHALIRALVGRGMSLSAIARLTGHDRKTVRRYADMPVPPTQANRPRARRRMLLDPFHAYLQRRVAAGCTNAARLFREVHAQGFRGSATLVRDFVRRAKRHAPSLRPQPPLRIRRVVTRMLRRHEDLSERDRQRLESACARSAALVTTRRLTGTFMVLLRERRGEELAAWVADAEASGVDEVAAFAAGLRRDWAAVVAGLTLEWSSGPVEGHVNRVKVLKRQMVGRAQLDLLRKRVLLAS